MRECNTHERSGSWLSAVLVVYGCAVAAASLPAEVDNAALLYYQAGFACPTPTDVRSFNAVLGGAEPNDPVREFLTWQSTQETLRRVEAATQIPRCNWGIRLAQGDELNVPASAQFQRLANLLAVQGRTLAYDGKHRRALEYSFMLRRFAAQMGDETPNMHQRSRSLDMNALANIRKILDLMPDDVETLVWLRGRLKEVRGTLWLPAKTLTGFRDHCISWLSHEYPNIGETWKQKVLGSTAEESVKMRIRDLTGQDLFTRGCESYDSFLKAALETIEGRGTYAEKDSALRKMESDIREHAIHGDPVGILVDSMYRPAGLVVSYYEDMVRHNANLNLTMIAVEVYLLKTKEGKLPTVLPANLLKDPFTGGDFEYGVTKNGFVLRYRTTRDRDEAVQAFDFTVR
jgi:hypothetical protein